MKKVQFIGRFANRKKKTKEEKHDDYIKSLLPPGVGMNQEDGEDEEDKIEFIYDPIVVDLEKIDEHIRLDHAHTQLNMSTGRMYIVKLPFDSFNELYQQQTGHYIYQIAFKPAEIQPRKRQSSLFTGPTVEPEISKETDEEE